MAATSRRNEKIETLADFLRRWEDAWERGADLLEEEMWRRAREGVEKPVFYQGKVVGHVREFSDVLVLELIRARPKHDYASFRAIQQDVRTNAGLEFVANVRRILGDELPIDPLERRALAILYAWDGARMAFVTDLLWASPIGLPVAASFIGQPIFSPKCAIVSPPPFR